MKSKLWILLAAVSLIACNPQSKKQQRLEQQVEELT